MNLEIFYEKYIYTEGKKKFHQLTKKEKEDVATIYRMWAKGLVKLNQQAKE